MLLSEKIYPKFYNNVFEKSLSNEKLFSLKSQLNPSEWWMNGPLQEIALAMVALLYKVKDAIVKIAFVDNEEINEYLWNKTRQGQSQ